MKSRMGRFILGTTGFVACVALFMGTALFTSHAQSEQNPQGKDDSDTVRQTYNFRFGKDNLSLPGNAASESNEFIQPGAFPNAEYCGHCHQEAYHQWRQALHSNSFRTPFYRTSVNILIKSKGIQFARHCDSCHNPVGIVAGALDANSTMDRSFDRDGLTCTTCHSIQSVKTRLGNGSFVMAVPAVM